MASLIMQNIGLLFTIRKYYSVHVLGSLEKNIYDKYDRGFFFKTSRNFVVVGIRILKAHIFTNKIAHFLNIF